MIFLNINNLQRSISLCCVYVNNFISITKRLSNRVQRDITFYWKDKSDIFKLFTNANFGCTFCMSRHLATISLARSS